MIWNFELVLVIISIVCQLVTTESDNFLVGIGIHDVTGPVGGVNLMGYAMPEQIAEGIHTRLYARAFIFEKDNNRLVYCSCDLAMISPNVKRRVVEKLRKLDGQMYSEKNVMISATHTHSAPAGYHDYLLYSITSLGYIHESADMMVEGIYGAILRAHNSMGERKLKIVKDKLENANINRSPSAYLANPSWEREIYKDDGNTEKTMTLMAIFNVESNDLAGSINWFSVHGTSMNNTNRLISSDNKGYASYLLEHEFNQRNEVEEDFYNSSYLSEEYHEKAKNGTLFVAAFSQSNEGDVSPNIEGAFCLNSGEPCDFNHSTCKDHRGKEQNYLCVAHGPGWKSGGDKESTRIIGLRQYAKASALLQLAKSSSSRGVNEMIGSVLFEHAWIDMSNTTVVLRNGSSVKTCLPARGYSFGAGTTDGPGAFKFRQGDNSTGNPFWNIVRRFIAPPTREQIQCHSPKPILINDGQAKFPYPWEPSIVDIQLFKIGSLFVLGVPAEFTTMAGRRLKRRVMNVFQSAGLWPEDGNIVIAGLSNSYSGYVTTFEEYQIQRYEGASTIFGPHTLSAYTQEFIRLAMQMCEQMGKTVIVGLPKASHDPRIPPKDFSKRLLTLLPPVVTDSAPVNKKFGDLKSNVKSCYNIGDTVVAEFYAGHPRNMVNVDPNGTEQLENYFMLVEKYVGSDVLLIKQEIERFVMRMVRSMKRPWFVVEKMEMEYRTVETTKFFEWISPKTKKIHVKLNLIELADENSLNLELTQDSTDKPLTMKYQLPEELVIKWSIIRDDSDWDTEFIWHKPVPVISPVSLAKLKWTITERPDKASAPYMINESERQAMNGLYRLKYRGSHRNIRGKISIHKGVSSQFQVVSHPEMCQDSSNGFDIIL